MALQFVEWKPVKNTEKTALRKFPFWIKTEATTPLRESAIYIAPIELGIINHANARWILREQVVHISGGMR